MMRVQSRMVLLMAAWGVIPASLMTWSGLAGATPSSRAMLLVASAAPLAVAVLVGLRVSPVAVTDLLHGKAPRDRR